MTTELTPVQQELENNLKHSPTICLLEESNKMLMEGQNSIQTHLNEVDDRLEDGSKIMKGLIADVKEVFSFISTQAARSEEMHRETKDALKDHKYQDIKDELKTLQIKAIDDKKKRWDIIKGFALLIIGAIISGISVHYVK